MSPPTLREPRQDRSRRTLERLLSTTERLLQAEPFDAISVQQIVRGARASVGAFYTRFADKQALLPALYARYDADLTRRLDELDRGRPWEGMSFAETVAFFVSHFVASFRRNVYLMRALALYARTHPGEIDAETRRKRAGQHRFLLKALLSRRGEIRHPDPERAVELAFFFAAAVCRDRILFADAPHSESTRISDPELVREVTRMILGYLNVSLSPQPRS